MTTYYVNSNNASIWAVGTVYNVGDRVVVKPSSSSTVNSKRFRVYECTTGGTSHGTTEPSWNATVGGTTNDNDVVWTTRNPTTWDNAHHSFLMLAYDYTVFAAGDVVLVHKTHNESIVSDYYDKIQFNGTVVAPVSVICVDKDNADALDTGAIITINKTARRFQDCGYFKNIQLVFAAADFTGYNNGSNVIIEGNGANTIVKISASGGKITNYYDNYPQYVRSLVIKNGDIEYSYANNYVVGGSYLEINNGTLIAPNGVTVFLKSAYVGKHRVRVFNYDLTAIGAGKLIDAISSDISADYLFSRCKLPSNLGGVLNTAFTTIGHQGGVRLHHCSYDQKTHGFNESFSEGTVVHETSIVRTGGASDGVTPVSWKLATSGNVAELGFPLKTPASSLWNNSASEKTLTVHGIIDSATNLQDDEVWLEVEYPQEATSGLGTLVTTQTVYSGIADLSASTETWTEAMANPNLFKLTATFTPGQAGPITARVCVGKPSTTLYICPKAEIS